MLGKIKMKQSHCQMEAHGEKGPRSISAAGPDRLPQVLAPEKDIRRAT